MHVIATAGHVDHGKSTLLRALTGIDPDRWAEEQRRGMTIDLGYAWADLPSGRRAAFIDVPGHHKFISNMLAGAGQVPAAMLVVAADEGWKEQTVEHVAALVAFGVRDLVAVVTRSDLADPAAAIAVTRERLAAAGLDAAETVAVSGVSGEGLADLRAALDRMVSKLREPPDAPARLWVDRSFVVRGSGTVVTGTLISGQLRVGDSVEIAPGDRLTTIRALESCKESRAEIDAVARVAVNLRGVAVSDVRRGDAVVAPGSCAVASVLDVALSAPLPPGRHMLHLGSSMVPARVRPLGGDQSRFCRLSLGHPVPVRLGDRGMVRDPGRREVLAGVLLLDADPPALRRRGAGSARAAELAAAHDRPPGADLVDWRGWMTDADLERLGARPDASARHVGTRWISADRWNRWAAELPQLVRDQGAGAGVSRGEAVLALGLPSSEVVEALLDVGECQVLEAVDGRLRVRGERAVPDEAADAGLDDLERRLAENPYRPPDHHQLAALGLDDRALGQATASGRLMRISGDVFLLPDAVDVAVERLRQLPQPFTVAQARDVLDSSRRVVLPLLQLLDSSRRTRRVDESHRSVIR